MTASLTADFEKQFADGPLIRAAVNLPAEAFSITVLFGPSGSGKTTILRCLAGLEHPDRGQIRFGAETWFDAAKRIHLRPQRRGIGFFFQDYALFPHLSVERNVAFGLSRLATKERRVRAREAIAFVGLQGLEDRYPKQLSGGQQQRVALARTLVRKPRLLLLDEPLSALDAPGRSELRRELRFLLAGLGAPILLVTHDRVEALALGDTVVVLNEGRVCQSGPVHEVFARPASPTVASIVGIETVEPARVLDIVDGLATVAVGEVHLTALDPGAGVGQGFICIRAEDVILEKHEPAPSSARNRLPGRILTLEREGPMMRVGVDCGFRLAALVTNQACRELELRPGDSVIAVIKAPAIHVIGR